MLAILPVPKSAESRTSSKAAIELFDLPAHPRHGRPCKFAVVDNQRLFEVCQIAGHGKHSLFYGDSVHSEGKLAVLSPVDPLFVMITALQQHDSVFIDINSLDNIPPQIVTIENIDSQLAHICDALEGVGASPMFKFNKVKALEWLQKKYNTLTAPLAQKLKQPTLTDTQIRLSIVSEYLSREWFDALKVALNVQLEVTATTDDGTATNENALPFEVDYTKTTNRPPISGKQAATNASKSKVKASVGMNRLKRANITGMKKMTSYFKSSTS